MSDALGFRFRLFKRKNGEKHVYYARLLDPQTGKLVKTVSTHETNKNRAIEWTLASIAREHEQIARETMEALQKSKNESLVTVSMISHGFWEPEAPYARGRRARGHNISFGHLDISEGYTRNHILPVWGKRSVSSISVGEVDRWILELHHSGKLAGGTINKILQNFRTLLDGAVRDGHISVNPAASVMPVRAIPLNRGILNDEEVHLLFLQPENFTNFIHYTVNLLAFSTGVRLGEVRGLCVEDVHSDRLEIINNWEEGYGLKGPKFGSKRTVPLLPKVYQALERVILETKSEKIVFHTQEDKSRPVSKNYIEKGLYDGIINMQLSVADRNDPEKRLTVLKKIRSRGISFHSWRHKMNTVLRAAGVPDSKIRLLTGHRGETMTDWYTKFDSTDFADALKAQDAVLLQFDKR